MASASRPRLKAVWFDLDGTLLDSFEGLARCYRHALAAFDRAPPDDDEIRACIGPPLRGNFARFLGRDDATTIEKAVGLFRERYDSVGWAESRLYDGVVDMVEAVKAQGARVLVATGKPQRYTDRILEKHGLTPRIEAAFGTRLDAALDDKVHLLAHALSTAGVEASTSALLGDRENDVRAARANGVLPIGVTWGFGSDQELLDAGAQMLLRSPGEVAAGLFP